MKSLKASLHGFRIVVGTADKFSSSAHVAHARFFRKPELVVIAFAAGGAGKAARNALDQGRFVNLKLDHRVEFFTVRREHAIKGLRLARELMNQPALKRFVQTEILPGAKVNTDDELFDYACANAKTDHHPVGTCRMGRPDDEHSVVTPDLRVIGIYGLRVVDASVMPFIPSCNTNAPTIMIAEKAADHILGRIQHPNAVRAERGVNMAPTSTAF